MNAQEAEAQLGAGYAEQARIYAQALNIARNFPSDSGSGSAGNGLLDRLGTLLREVADIENRLAPVKQFWLILGRKPEKELALCLNQITESILNLQQRLDRLNSDCVTRQRELAPQLDALARGKHMRKAYEFAAGRNSVHG